jgi:hypothetical protein
MNKRFQYKILETESDWDTFTILRPEVNDIYDIIQEAARLYYFGRAGWMEAWPLTFLVRSESGLHLAKAFVFVLSPTPNFDVIIPGK